MSEKQGDQRQELKGLPDEESKEEITSSGDKAKPGQVVESAASSEKLPISPASTMQEGKKAAEQKQDQQMPNQRTEASEGAEEQEDGEQEEEELASERSELFSFGANFRYVNQDFGENRYNSLLEFAMEVKLSRLGLLILVAVVLGLICYYVFA